MRSLDSVLTREQKDTLIEYLDKIGYDLDGVKEYLDVIDAYDIMVNFTHPDPSDRAQFLWEALGADDRERLFGWVLHDLHRMNGKRD